MLLRDLAKLSPQKKQEALAELVERSRQPPNGQLTALYEILGTFEAKYGMSTDDMIEKFRAGELEDTPDIARWLVLSKARGR